MNYEDLKQRIIYKKLLTTLDVRKSVTNKTTLKRQKYHTKDQD